MFANVYFSNSDILFEGLNQFKHTGDGELFNLGKGEYVDIYGENEDFYLAQVWFRHYLLDIVYSTLFNKQQAQIYDLSLST